jgi:hypothetical protein
MPQLGEIAASLWDEYDEIEYAGLPVRNRICGVLQHISLLLCAVAS